MICKVISTVERYGLLDNVRSVAVGVSGGADSVCLLNILTTLKDKYGIIVKAVHVNHNIRGEEALRDENFVRKLCNDLGVELKVFSVDVRAEAKRLGIGEEECGRKVRYECFAALNCDAVAVAHSLSDSIETMLFNLARGTAIKGLCGIPPFRKPNIIRPLICCTRNEIELYCSENKLDYVTDSTNLTCDYMRNHIRHKLIPDIGHINSAFEKSISRCMDSLSEDSDYLDCAAEELYNNAFCDGAFSVPVLKEAHIALRKRVFHRILSSYMIKDVDKKHVLLLEDIVSGKTSKAEIAKDIYIVSENNKIFVSHGIKAAEEWKSIFLGGVAQTPYGRFCLSRAYAEGDDTFDAGLIKCGLYISSRQPGDSFTSKKRKITKSLKKLFNEMKIPAEDRNRVAVIHDGNNVVWVEGIGVNSYYAVSEATKEFLTVKKEG
ncbi:MAG: tRNA lysidine(34) synthetase TilS [Clostridia bacterium]|nr:tRNA lysidine(34) synthetase TilS [Clostridia bacterium]